MFAIGAGLAGRVRDGLEWGWEGTREKKHVPLVDPEIFEFSIIVDDLEEHATLVLVEPFGSRVDVVVVTGVGPADDHHGHVLVVDTVVVDRRLEEMGVLGEPLGKVVSTAAGAAAAGGSGEALPFGDVERG
jgi:hypothetical protein